MESNISSFLGEAESIPKRVMPFIIMIDTSGSMEGKKIGAVNSAIEEMLPDLRKLSDENADSEIRLAVMTFSSGVEWVTPGLVSLDSMDDWEPITTDWTTDMGAAFCELNAKLSKNGFMDRSSASSGFYAPVLMLLSDGDPTDDYKSGLKELKENNWYKSATKIAIAIGDDANKDILKEFTNNSELVISVDKTSQLKKVVRFVAVTSSQIASSSASVSSGSNAPVDLSDVSSATAEKQIAESISNMLSEENNTGYDLFSDDNEPKPAGSPLEIAESSGNGIIVDDDNEDDWE